MTDVYAMLDGHRVTHALVHVPARGPWFADVDMETDPDVSGRVTLALGALELEGTVAPTSADSHGLQRRVRVVAGGGGWGALVRAKAYHNDARIRARTIVEDVAREVGEELGDFAPAAERVGIDYVRSAGAAARVLEDVIGGSPWWVGYDGRTHVGARTISAAAASAYEVLEHDPRARVVTLAVDDLSAIAIGSVLSERLDEPQTVRELEVAVTPDRVRVRAWCGADGGYGNLLGLFRSIARRATDEKLFGPWRYRVVRMSGDRVELQAVNREAGLPDIRPVSMWPGVPGVRAELAGSTEVLVEFVEGDRTMPIITHFLGFVDPGDDQPNAWVPVNITHDVQQIMKLGRFAESFVALADAVKDRIDSLQNAHDLHKHTGGTIDGNTGVPDTIVGPLAGVAATKVKAE